MNEATEEHPSNVIEVSFSSKKEDHSLDIEHPASVWFDETLSNDPLEDLLNEFEDLTEEDLVVEKEDYIFHHQKKKDFNLSYKEDSISMTEKLLDQTRHLREDLKRLSYYLDEMNIDS
jgi:hypothetical protein